MILTLTACDKKCEPTILYEVKYVPKVVEKTIMVQCKIDMPLCDKLEGQIDEKLFITIKCISDLKMYINKCNEG